MVFLRGLFFTLCSGTSLGCAEDLVQCWGLQGEGGWRSVQVEHFNKPRAISQAPALLFPVLLRMAELYLSRQCSLLLQLPFVSPGDSVTTPGQGHTSTLVSLHQLQLVVLPFSHPGGQTVHADITCPEGQTPAGPRPHIHHDPGDSAMPPPLASTTLQLPPPTWATSPFLLPLDQSRECAAAPQL